MHSDERLNAEPTVGAPLPISEARRPSWKLGLLFLIPLALPAISSDLKNARGPYWLGSQSDPEYAYLLNSLRLVHGLPPAHRDHPGTPVQIFGAAVLRGSHPSLALNELTHHVIQDPEAHLDLLRRCIAWIYALVLLTTGVVVYAATGSLVPAICMQATPFLSVTALLEIPRFKPEPILMILTLLLALILFLHLNRPATRRLWLTATLSGGLVGLAVATKITALPVAVVPLLLLPTHRSRAGFLLAAFVSFFVGILPMLTYFPELVLWIRNILTHQGNYGSGEVGFADPARLLDATKRFAFREPCMLVILGLSIWAIVRSLTRSTSGSTSRFADPSGRALLAIVLAQFFQWLIAAKQHRFHHLVPSLSFAGLSVTLLIGVALREGWMRKRWRAFFLATLIAAATVAQVREILICRGWQLEEKAHQLAVQGIVLNQYKNWTKVYGYGTSSIEFALYFGDQFSDGFFYPWLRADYPDPKIIYCDVFSGEFRSSHGPIGMEDLMRTRRRLLLRGGVLLQDLMSDWTLTKVVSGDRERLYEWKAKP